GDLGQVVVFGDDGFEEKGLGTFEVLPDLLVSDEGAQVVHWRPSYRSQRLPRDSESEVGSRKSEVATLLIAGRALGPFRSTRVPSSWGFVLDRPSSRWWLGVRPVGEARATDMPFAGEDSFTRICRTTSTVVGEASVRPRS